MADPVLSGWHPDPSICRADDAYYLVTSTFAYHPGLPVHRSTDLRTWTLVGHVLEGDSWLPLDGFDVSDGVWAPTIRYHDGRFFVVFALAHERRGAGIHVTTATDAAGPWTPPVRLDGEGIDPSLFVDPADARWWLTAARDAESPTATGPGELWLREFDPHVLALVGPTHVLWHGAVTGAWVEAPHLVERDGVYHLLGAEGGTEHDHAVTAARASAVTGPYRTDPRSPLLTHRHFGPGTAVQNVGHADLVDTPDGDTWAALLAVRPVGGHHTLGRETYLVPVQWDARGPVFAPGSGRIELDGHGADVLGPTDWLSLRGPIDATVDDDGVVLRPHPDALHSTGRPALLGLRQTAHESAFRCTVDPDGIGDTIVGVTAFQNDGTFATLQLRSAGGAVTARCLARIRGAESVLGEREVRGRVVLGIRTFPRTYTFTLTDDEGETMLGELPHTALSTETAGGFVGVVLGVFAHGSEDAPPVRFDDVRHEPAPGA